MKMLVIVVVCVAVASAYYFREDEYMPRENYFYRSMDHYQRSPAPGCIQVSPVQDFDFDKYMGTWYEIKRWPNRFEAGQSCVTSDNKGSVERNGWNRVDISTTSSKYGSPHQEAAYGEQQIKGIGELTMSKGSHHLKRPNMWVLDVKYDEYALLYSCTKVLGMKFVGAWINSRTPTLPEDKIKELEAKMDSMGVDSSRLEAVDQASCHREKSFYNPYPWY